MEISSSNFPTYDVNLNNFRIAKDGTYADSKVATQKIYHDEEHPTRDSSDNSTFFLIEYTHSQCPRLLRYGGF
jgi:hypothetical protein